MAQIREHQKPFVMSHWFVRLAHMMNKGRLLHQPSQFLLVLANDDNVSVYFHGLKTWDEYSDLAHAFHDHSSHKRFNAPTPTESRASRRKHEAQREAEEQAYLAAHPHKCPGCRQLFKTEKGLAQHRNLSKRKQWATSCHPSSG